MGPIQGILKDGSWTLDAGISLLVRCPIVSTLPSGKHTKSYGKSQFLMGKTTISMAIFNSHVKLPEGIYMIPIIVDFYIRNIT